MSLSTDNLSEVGQRLLPADLGDKVDQLRDTVGDADTRVRELVKEYPLATVFGALAAGYLLGRLFARV